MKYWIYKDSRILGPYERDAISGLPGFDAGTLVCAGENAGAAEGQWAPAADIPELAPLTLGHGPTWSPDAPTSSFGLLDKLQIESAGLIGDEQYPSAGEVLFQDAEIKRSFAELLVQRTRTDDTEVRRLRGLVSELSVQLELMYRRIAQLENTHTDFLQRLTLPETAARAAASAAAAPPAPAAPAAAAPAASAPFSFAPAPAPVVAPTISFAAPAPAVLPAAPVAPAASAPAAPAEASAAPAAAEAPVAPTPAVPGEIVPVDAFAGEWPAPLPASDNFPNFSALATMPEAKPVSPQPDIPPLKPFAAPAAEIPAPAPIEPPAPAATGAAAPAPFAALVPETSAAAPFAPSTKEPAADAEVSFIGADESSSAPTPPLPPLPDFSATAATAQPEPPAPAAPEAESPATTPEAAAPTPSPVTARKLVFDKPKTLRIVPTLKSFKVVDAGGPVAAEPVSAAPAAPEAFAPETIPPPPGVVAPTPSLAPAAPEPEAHAPMPDFAPSIPAPVPAASFPVPEPPSLAPSPAPSPAASPFTMAAPSVAPSPEPAPMSAFPSTGSLPVAGGAAAAAAAEPPVTAVFAEPTFGVAPGAAAPMPATQEVLARLAKPAVPPTSAPARPPRSNKKFLLVGGLGAVVLVLVVTLFLRHTRTSDLNHMASLDDGKPQLGAEPIDDSARPPVVKPPMADAAAPNPMIPAQPAATGPAPIGASPAPAASPTGAPTAAPQPAPAPAAPAAPAAPSPQDLATNFVKNFPLDGNRGTVSKWLDYSYMASPDAGQGVWTATLQSDNTYLVEYRFAASVQGAPEILYLFEADPDRGYVLGKNRDAKDLLAGGGPRITARAAVAVAAKPRKKAPAHKRKPVKAAAAPSDDDANKPVPQLALPTDGELHAPAEDDGDFGSDTVKSDE